MLKRFLLAVTVVSLSMFSNFSAGQDNQSNEKQSNKTANRNYENWDSDNGLEAFINTYRIVKKNLVFAQQGPSPYFIIERSNVQYDNRIKLRLIPQKIETEETILRVGKETVFTYHTVRCFFSVQSYLLLQYEDLISKDKEDSDLIVKQFVQTYGCGVLTTLNPKNDHEGKMVKLLKQSITESRPVIIYGKMYRQLFYSHDSLKELIETIKTKNISFEIDEVLPTWEEKDSK